MMLSPAANSRTPRSVWKVAARRQRVVIFHHLAQRLVEPLHVVIGVGENEKFITAQTDRLFAIGSVLD
jgi:hypothetical protein